MRVMFGRAGRGGRSARQSVTGERRGRRRVVHWSWAVPLAALLAVSGTSVAAASSAAPAATPAASAAPAAAGQRLASLNPGDGVPATAITAGAVDTCAAVAAKAGFSFNVTVATSRGRQPQIVVAVAIAMAESSCDRLARAGNGPTPGCPSGSTDRGLWQINSCYQPEVSDACAYQVQCNADAAWRISNHGTDWSPWSTFNNHAWENYLSLARSAVSGGVTFQLADAGAHTCLDADSHGAVNGGRVFQWKCDGGDRYQQWSVVDRVGSLYLLRNAGTGLCLDADGSLRGDGKPIYQWHCDSADGSQQWWFNGSGQLNSDGAAFAGLENSHDRTCVAADGGKVGNGDPIFQWTCSGSDRYQHWN